MEEQETPRAHGKTERIAIFIDGSNFYHSIKDSLGLHDNEVDFIKLIEILKNSGMLIGIYYYNASLDRGYNENSMMLQYSSAGTGTSCLQ
jgi:uncharacterized LabA/DUF88 family protein